MGDYYGIMAKTAPKDADETDAQAALTVELLSI